MSGSYCSSMVRIAAGPSNMGGDRVNGSFKRHCPICVVSLDLCHCDVCEPRVSGSVIHFPSPLRMLYALRPCIHLFYALLTCYVRQKMANRVYFSSRLCLLSFWSWVRAEFQAGLCCPLHSFVIATAKVEFWGKGRQNEAEFLKLSSLILYSLMTTAHCHACIMPVWSGGVLLLSNNGVNSDPWWIVWYR